MNRRVRPGYLLDRRGRPVERFDQSTEPDDAELTQAIDQLGDPSKPE